MSLVTADKISYSVDDLLKFNIEGYTYNDELSNGEVITFTRKNI